MTQNFVDVSSYQGGIDFTQLDCDGVIIKVSGGVGYLNPYATAQHASARAAGKIIRLYHFAHELGCQGTAAAEAAFFLQHAAPLMDGVEGLDLDWESDNQADTAWAKEWLDTVAPSSPTAPYFYANLAAINAYNWTASGVTAYPLWLAWYPYTTPQGWGPLSGLPALNHWAAPAIWQYSSTGQLAGWGGNLDLSIRYETPSGSINPQSIPTQEDSVTPEQMQDLKLFVQGCVNDSINKMWETEAVTQKLEQQVLAALANGIVISRNQAEDIIQAVVNRAPSAFFNFNYRANTNLAGTLDAIVTKPAAAGTAPAVDPQAIADAIVNGINVQIVKK